MRSGAAMLGGRQFGKEAMDESGLWLEVSAGYHRNGWLQEWRATEAEPISKKKRYEFNRLGGLKLAPAQPDGAESETTLWANSNVCGDLRV